MKLLLDTCTFLWAIAEQRRLSRTCRDLLVDPGNTVYLSAASAWEICLKAGSGTLTLSEPAAQFVPRYRQAHGYEALPIDERAVLQLPRLPNHHRDPFDRILVCQAVAHGLTLLTPDPLIGQYPVAVAW